MIITEAQILPITFDQFMELKEEAHKEENEWYSIVRDFKKMDGRDTLEFINHSRRQTIRVMPVASRSKLFPKLPAGVVFGIIVPFRREETPDFDSLIQFMKQQ